MTIEIQPSGLSLRRWVWTAGTVAIVAACSSPRHLAPVEDRGLPLKDVSASSESVRLPPGAENAGKPGYYTVRPGDTLMRIGLETGQSRHDIQQWNSLVDPNSIEVGQVLRVVPPVGAAAATNDAASGVVVKGVSLAKVEAKPLDAKEAGKESPTKPVSPSAASAPVPVLPNTGAATTPLPNVDEVKEGEEGIAWAWPATGAVITEFDEVRSKGLVISGKAGDPVFAAADGRVVYAGSGLRGYGNLVIIKHTTSFLTAYAHNQKLLVKEDQSVKRGQRIAEMGSSDAQKVQLHFEVRKQGKPIDPAKLLPSR